MRRDKIIAVEQRSTQDARDGIREQYDQETDNNHGINGLNLYWSATSLKIQVLTELTIDNAERLILQQTNCLTGAERKDGPLDSI